MPNTWYALVIVLGRITKEQIAGVHMGAVSSASRAGLCRHIPPRTGAVLGPPDGGERLLSCTTLLDRYVYL